MWLDLRPLVLRDGHSDDRPRPGHAARATQGLLRSDEDVGDILVLAEERDVQEDLEGPL